jgi:hypothetical protein
MAAAVVRLHRSYLLFLRPVIAARLARQQLLNVNRLPITLAPSTVQRSSQVKSMRGKRTCLRRAVAHWQTVYIMDAIR